MTRQHITSAIATLCLVLASHSGSAQVAGSAPAPSNPKLDALIQALQPYIPNHGTLSMGRGDTLIYAAVLTGTRHIPLGDVEVAIFPDSSRAGFQCAGTRECILFEPGSTATNHEIQMLDQVPWGGGSVRKIAAREMKFQGDPIPFKRVTAALNDLVGVRTGVRAVDPGTVPPSSAVELSVREMAIGLMNLPASRWTTVFSGAGITIGVDLQTVRPENANRVAWIKTTFETPQQFPEGFSSLVFAEQRFDCAGKRTQVIRSVLAVSGQVTARAKDPGDHWSAVGADPTVRGILERVCGTP